MTVFEMTTRTGRIGSIDSSGDCSVYEDDPQTVSIQLLTGANARQNVRKAYQSVVDMLDADLQVIGESEKSDFFDLPSAPKKSSSESVVPCLATVLFFNECQEESQESKHQKAPASNVDSLSKPDLLLNHTWTKQRDLESDFSDSLDLNENDVTTWNRQKKPFQFTDTNAPFLRYEAILRESQDNERHKDDINMERDIGFRKGIFDFEVAERTLVARKQLETWPWEFHHKADTKKGITQCQWNTQDFYAYQPERDVTRLYGDVIDTTKITKRKSIAQCYNDDYHARTGEESDATTTSTSSRYSDFEYNKRPISTSDFPLMGIREVHYGKQHLRYTLFVSDANWMYQVEFYRLLLRRCSATLRKDFCLFTVYHGENTDIQFAVKKLGTKQRPLPLCSAVLQFKVHKVGSIVPLLPNSCKPITKTKWQTTDHDGNIVVLEICPYLRNTISETANTLYRKKSTPLDDTVTSQYEARISSEDDNLSLERLDSFVEPELPERMPLLQSSLYSYLPQRSRFGARYTSSRSAGSSSSTSPERKTNPYKYRDRPFTPSHSKVGSDSSLSIPHHSSIVESSSPRISESSDDPENINFYRKAKARRESRRRDTTKSTTRSRSKSSSRREKQKQKSNLSHAKPIEDEVVVFV